MHILSSSPDRLMDPARAATEAGNRSHHERSGSTTSGQGAALKLSADEIELLRREFEACPMWRDLLILDDAA